MGYLNKMEQKLLIIGGLILLGIILGVLFNLMPQETIEIIDLPPIYLPGVMMP